MSDIMDPSKLKVAELRAELQARGLDSKGNKPVLVERLRAALEEEEEGHEEGDDAAVGEEEEEELLQEEEVAAEAEAENYEELPVSAKEPEPPQPEPEVARRKPESPIKKTGPPQKEPEPSPKKPEPQSAKAPVPVPVVKEEPEDSAKLGYEDAPMEELADKSEAGNGVDLNIKEEDVEIKEEAMEVKQEPEESGGTARRGEKRALSRSRSPEAAPEAKKQRPEVEEVRVEDEPEYDKTVVALDWYNSDLSLVISKEDFLSAQPLTMQGFGYVWHGVRATYGFTRGRVFFEVKGEDYMPVPQLEEEEQHPHVLRVGWSVDDAGLTLGEDPFSYGYGGTGKASTNLKFKDYGKTFGKGDIVGCFLDLESEPVVMSFTVNGQHQGIAYEISHSDLGDQALFPHIVTKNTSFRVNFGSEAPWMEPLNGYTFTGKIPLEDRVLGTQGPEKREDAEVSTMPRKKSSESPAHLSDLMSVEDPSVEYADGESSPHPDGVAEDDVMGGPSGRQPHAKRRCRPSKKDIPNYKFSEEQEKAVAEFVHEHSALYDKKDKRWCDPKFKEALWQEVAETFPDCSFLQVKKFFEMRRTDFGKIEKKANKSGSAARKLTPREEVVMATWGFLGGHIAHEPTQSSERFSPTVSHRSSSSESGHSAHSIIRRRNLGMVKRKRTGTETTTHSSVPEDDDSTIKDLLNEAKKIMERRETTGVEAEIQDFSTYLCSRLRKVARRNHKVLFPKILELVSLMEEEPGDEVGEGKIDGEKVLSQHSTPQQPAQPPQQHYQPPQQQYQPPQQLYQPPQQPAQPPQQYQSPQQPAQPPQQYQPPQHPAQPPQQYQSPQQAYQPPQQQYQTPQQQYQPVYTVLSTPQQQIPTPAAATVTTNPSPFTFPVSLEMMVPSVKSPSVASISSTKSVLETPKVNRPVDNLDSDEDDD